MSNQEGVIKFKLEFSVKAVDESLFDLKKINIWRQVCLEKSWIGQVADRYEGLGFGNISTRIGNTDEFIITGTQTGGLTTLEGMHFSHVDGYAIENNWVSAKGLLAPSSESMTHAVLYQQDKNISAIIHIHAPSIWRETQIRGLAFTKENVPYGTVQMALAVENLCVDFGGQGVFSMLGHEDGIVAFGRSLDQAGKILLGVDSL